MVYLARLAGVFPHPLDHLVGLGCWFVVMGACVVRSLWESREGHFPVRIGGTLALVLAFAAGIGILAELSVASSATHTENQPYRIHQTE